MVSTFSDRNRLEKQGDGENKNSWGTILNNNVDLLDEALGGYQVVSVSAAGAGNYTLTTNNGASDTSRQAALEFSGTLTADVTIVLPSKEKTYLIRENSSGSFAVKMKTAAGSLITLAQGQNTAIMCDGTEIYKLTTPTSVATFTATHLDSTSISATNILAVQVCAANIFATSVSASVFTGVNGTFTGTVSASAFDGLGNKLTYGTDAQGDILYHNGTDIQNLAAGTSGQFLKTLGAAANPVWAAGGSLAQPPQTVINSTGSTLGTTTIPIDNTAPEITEGNAISSFQVSITPTDVSSTIEVDVDMWVGHSSGAVGIAALFINGDTSAVATGIMTMLSNVPTNMSIHYKETAVSLGAREFTVRLGATSGANNTFLNRVATEYLNSTLSSKITVKEYLKV